MLERIKVRLKSLKSNILGSGWGAYAITPKDTTDLPTMVRAIYCGNTGNIEMLTWSGDDLTPVVFENVQAGTTLDVAAKRVLAANTTATSLVALQ